MPSQLAPTAEEDSGAVSSGDSMRFWTGLLDFLMQPWFLLAVLVLAIAAALWPARSAVEPEVVLPRSIKTARRMLVRILRALGTRGHLRQRGQTLEQFGSLLLARERLAPGVADAFRSYQEVRFGGYPFDGEREKRLMRGLEDALATEPLDNA